MLHPQPWTSANECKALGKPLVYIRAAKCQQWLTPPPCSKNTQNQGLRLKRLQTGPVKMIHFPVRPGLKWNNEIHFKVEQICTGGGNILKPALAHCAKQIESEQECEWSRGGDWCVWMWMGGSHDGELIEGDGLHNYFGEQLNQEEKPERKSHSNKPINNICGTKLFFFFYKTAWHFKSKHTESCCHPNYPQASQHLHWYYHK